MVDFTLLSILLIVVHLTCSALKVGKGVDLWICIFILMVMSAFRGPEIGNDTEEYIRIFGLFRDPSYDFSISRYEIGYIWFNKIIGFFTDDYQWVFIVYSVIFYSSIGRFINKYSKLPWFSLFLFFSYGFFNFSFTAIRQGLAVSILLFSFDYIKGRRFIKFAILVLAASCFHATAFLFIIAYLAVFIRPTIRNFIYIILVGIAGYILFTTVFGFVVSYFEYYEHYANTAYIGDAGVANTLYIVISSIILFVSYSFLKGDYKLLHETLNVNGLFLILVAFAVAIYIISLKANIFDRLALYFNIYSIVLLPNACCRLNLRSRKIMEIISVGAFYLYAVTVLMLRPDWISIYPYSFCF